MIFHTFSSKIPIFAGYIPFNPHEIPSNLDPRIQIPSYLIIQIAYNPNPIIPLKYPNSFRFTPFRGSMGIHFIHFHFGRRPEPAEPEPRRSDEGDDEGGGCQGCQILGASPRTMVVTYGTFMIHTYVFIYKNNMYIYIYYKYIYIYIYVYIYIYNREISFFLKRKVSLPVSRKTQLFQFQQGG